MNHNKSITQPPIFSNFSFNSLASLLEQPAFKITGVLSTNSLASFKPSPNNPLTSLITLILEEVS